MAARRVLHTVRASLIDRLVDETPRSNREARPLRTLSRAKLRESVLRDLSWLLNTRTPLPGKEYDRRDLTVIDYGIPDFGYYSPANVDDQALLERRIRRAIECFEPRLTQVRVEVSPVMKNEKTLTVVIQAHLRVDTVMEPVSFLTIFHSKYGAWEVHEND